MRPQDFYEKMKEIKEKYGDDEETPHVMMDKLMCDLLKELGYEKGIEVFKNTERYYS